MNPLYQMLMGQTQPQTPVQQNNKGYSGVPVFQNPIQKWNYIMQAIQNPVAFVRQAIPDLPQDISNDPNRIIQYLQQTRGISNETIRNLYNYIPRF